MGYFLYRSAPVVSITFEWWITPLSAVPHFSLFLVLYFHMEYIYLLLLVVFFFPPFFLSSLGSRYKKHVSLVEQVPHSGDILESDGLLVVIYLLGVFMFVSVLHSSTSPSIFPQEVLYYCFEIEWLRSQQGGVCEGRC